MPLTPAPEGSKGFGENIKKEEEAGKPQAQAVAIAYAEARKHQASKGKESKDE